MKHPQKTTISRVEKGFEFLGYHFGRDGLSLASKTIDNFLSKALRLYEQEMVQTRFERLGEYTKRWLRWTTYGLHDSVSDCAKCIFLLYRWGRYNPNMTMRHSFVDVMRMHCRRNGMKQSDD